MSDLDTDRLLLPRIPAHWPMHLNLRDGAAVVQTHTHVVFDVG